LHEPDVVDADAEQLRERRDFRHVRAHHARRQQRQRAGRLVEAGKVGAFVARKAPSVAGARRNDERFLLHARERANAGTGTFHSDALHIVERYTRVSKDRIDCEATMEDPNALTKPWVLQSSLMLREGTRLQEYVCAENNLDPHRYEQLLRNGVDFTRN
jgi:hypothetical protein